MPCQRPRRWCSQSLSCQSTQWDAAVARSASERPMPRGDFAGTPRGANAFTARTASRFTLVCHRNPPVCSPPLRRNLPREESIMLGTAGSAAMGRVRRRPRRGRRGSNCRCRPPGGCAELPANWCRLRLPTFLPRTSSRACSEKSSKRGAALRCLPFGPAAATRMPPSAQRPRCLLPVPRGWSCRWRPPPTRGRLCCPRRCHQTLS